MYLAWEPCLLLESYHAGCSCSRWVFYSTACLLEPAETQHACFREQVWRHLYGNSLMSCISTSFWHVREVGWGIGGDEQVHKELLLTLRYYDCQSFMLPSSNEWHCPLFVQQRGLGSLPQHFCSQGCKRGVRTVVLTVVCGERCAVNHGFAVNERGVYHRNFIAGIG